MAASSILSSLQRRLEGFEELVPGFHNILVSLRRKYPEEQTLSDAARVVSKWRVLLEQNEQLDHSVLSSLWISLHCATRLVDKMAQFQPRIRADDVSSLMAVGLMRNRIDAVVNAQI